MAASLAAAFGKVEGPELDFITGLSIPQPRSAPTESAVVTAFEGVGYGPFRTIARKLSVRYRCHVSDAEEAVQDGILDLYEKRRTLFREDPSNWLALLYVVAKFRLFGIKGGQQRVASIEGLREVAGDAALEQARPCIPVSLDAEEESRYGVLPCEGEAWNRSQMIGAAQRFRDYYGRPPKLSDCTAANRLPGPSLIYRVFSSFEDLILSAGMTPETLGRRRARWSAVEAAQTCESFKRRNGYWPSWIDIKRCPGELPSTSVMIRFFGGTRAIDVQLGAEAILGT